MNKSEKKRYPFTENRNGARQSLHNAAMLAIPHTRLPLACARRHLVICSVIGAALLGTLLAGCSSTPKTSTPRAKVVRKAPAPASAPVVISERPAVIVPVQQAPMPAPSPITTLEPLTPAAPAQSGEPTEPAQPNEQASPASPAAAPTTAPTSLAPDAATDPAPAAAPGGEPPTSAAPAATAEPTTEAPKLDGTEGAPRETFAQWKQGFIQRARESGISDATIHVALDNVKFIPRIVELDRAQPEFTRPPWTYIDNAVSQARIDQGRALIKRHQPIFDAAEKQYGVPASVITAIWGMESNFGRNFGSFRAVDAFATLAYDGRRAEWASRELLIALKIIDRGDIAATQMLGSWAGAMGHTQFLPSAFLRFAVDADGDGRRDIWGSIPDVIYSTANFLAQSGWKTGEIWGAEVRLPSGFDYARAEIKVQQSASAWAAEGVRSLNGSPLPGLDDASIITPAGARGPAILVGNNFRTLLKYNNSNNYALAVALIAQQIDGGTGLTSSWPRELEPLSRSEVRALQEALNAKGFTTGTPDGVAGPATRSGLREYQKTIGLPADGYPTKELLGTLLETSR